MQSVEEFIGDSTGFVYISLGYAESLNHGNPMIKFLVIDGGCEFLFAVKIFDLD